MPAHHIGTWLLGSAHQNRSGRYCPHEEEERRYLRDVGRRCRHPEDQHRTKQDGTPAQPPRQLRRSQGYRGGGEQEESCQPPREGVHAAVQADEQSRELEIDPAPRLEAYDAYEGQRDEGDHRKQ